jgi:hypothetical protein
MYDQFTELSEDEIQVDQPSTAAERQRLLRDAALLPGPDRHQYLQSHPLHASIVEIKSPPIRAALLLAQEAVKFRRPGLAFAADCRHGKTTMVAMVSRALGEMFPSVPYEVITAAKHDKPTEKAIWTDVLQGFGIEAAGTAMDRKSAATNAILTACLESGGDTFALYIDEGQNWGDLEFNFLRDLSNELRGYKKKTLITITAGDLKLKKVADAIRASDKGLWSRFLRTVQVFTGISSRQELREFMEEYDSPNGCEYPLASGVCYSQFFVPHAYANGWRLAHEADRLWEELEAVAQMHKQTLSDVGMQWIAESILTFLTLQMEKDAPGVRPSGDDWKDAVTSSQFETTFL